MQLGRPCRILLVEDNLAEIRLFREALKQSTDSFELHTAPTGEDALDVMYCRGPHSGTPRPDLIVLDINLPKIDGYAVLKSVKNEPCLRQIPVLMLTGSASSNDVRFAYDNHANAYLRKPTDLFEYFRLVSELKRFWLQVAVLPTTA